MANPDIVEDLRHIQQFCATAGDSVKQQQHAAILRRVEQTRVTPQMAQALASAVVEGPWTDDQKTSLSQAVSQALVNAPGPAPRRGMQTCENFQAYLSNSELAMCLDPTVAVVEKADVCATRMLRIGLHCPSEPTFGMVVQLMACEGSTPDDLKKHLETLKRVFRTKRSKWPKNAAAEHILTFPADPLALQNVNEHYKDEDPPSRRNVLPGTLSGPLRGNNKQLAKNMLAEVPTGNAMGWQQCFSQMMVMQQQQLAALMGQTCGGGGGDPLANLLLFKKKPKALTDAEPVRQQASPQQGSLPISAPEPSAATAAVPAPEQVPPAPEQVPPATQQVPPATEPVVPDANDHAVLQLPEISAEEQATLVSNALTNRKTQGGAGPKAKAKAKGKAKAKPGAKAKTIKATAKAVAKSQAKAPANNDHGLKTFVVNGKKLTPAFRIKKFPQGCSKCRERVGCTMSCWIARKWWGALWHAGFNP